MARTPVDESTAFTGVAGAMPVVEASTTSRVLVDNDAVRVVMFTFDAGEELTEHTASLPVVVQLVSGTMALEVGGQVHELAPGDGVYLAPRAPHSLQAHEACRLTLTMVRSASD